MMSIGDLIFQGAEALRTTRLVEFSLSLSDSSFSLWLQDHFFAIPAFQTLHILGIAVLFSSSLLMGLRVLGVSGRDQNLEAAYRRYRPWIWSSLAVIIFSGVILVIAEPVRNLTNPVFWTKMTLLVVGALRKLKPEASAEDLRNYLHDLTGVAGINGFYDFKAVPNRGLGEQNVVVTRWDAAAQTWDVVSDPLGIPRAK